MSLRWIWKRGWWFCSGGRGAEKSVTPSAGMKRAVVLLEGAGFADGFGLGLFRLFTLPRRVIKNVP